MTKRLKVVQLLLLLPLLSLSHYAKAGTDDGLVAYYPFNGTADDESNNGNDGVVNGAILVPDRFGNPDSAYHFDGQSSYISAAPTDDWSLAGDFSLAGWFKVDANANAKGRTIISTTDNGALSSGWGFMPRHANDDAYFLASSGIGSWNLAWIGPYIELNVDEWYHFVIQREENTLTFFINGAVIFSEQNSESFLTNNALFIGGFSNQLNTWHGILDDIRIYNRALSSTEIESIMEECSDSDLDGICDDEDVCPGFDDTQDSDGDGLPDDCDVCPDDDQNDADGDTVCGDIDNCSTVPNNDQIDFDNDGLGNACDEDIDGDGVDNDTDICGLTEQNAVVDPASGCSIDQLCPCDGPLEKSKTWKNLGKYVKCVAHASQHFVRLGLITETEKCALMSEAAKSDCGHKKSSCK